MMVFPFSSDQFNIAYDVELHGLGAVLDPNRFTREVFLDRLAFLLGRRNEVELGRWREHLSRRGPDFAVRKIQGTQDSVGSVARAAEPACMALPRR